MQVGGQPGPDQLFFSQLADAQAVDQIHDGNKGQCQQGFEPPGLEPFGFKGEFELDRVGPDAIFVGGFYEEVVGSGM